MTRILSLPAAVAALLLGGSFAPIGAETIVVEADRIHTVSGSTLEDGIVVVRDGRITEVGRAGSVRAPGDARRLSAPVVTPGLIDAHGSLGLAGLFNVRADQDENEETGPNQAGLRALDSFNPNEPLLEYVLMHGITVVQSGPGPANPIAGQMGIFRTHGETADEMVIRFPSAMLFNLGEVPKETYGSDRKFPSTRMGTAALIRRELQGALDYERKRSGDDESKRPNRDLALEALLPVAKGDLPAVFMGQREDDLLTALRITREFSLDTRLSGAAEAYLVRDAIREAGVPVLVGPLLQRLNAPEVFNSTYENPYFLEQAGIPFAFRSGYEGYVPKTHIVLFEAAIAAANRLGPEAALRGLTLEPARILDIADDFGSIDRGKVGDLVLFDGDPFEYTTQVVAVIVAGEVVYERAE